MTREELEQKLPAGIYMILDEKFLDMNSGRTMKLAEFGGEIWLCAQNPDGVNWHTLRKATIEDAIAIKRSQEKQKALPDFLTS